jgi:hypothetical protein
MTSKEWQQNVLSRAKDLGDEFEKLHNHFSEMHREQPIDHFSIQMTFHTWVTEKIAALQLIVDHMAANELSTQKQLLRLTDQTTSLAKAVEQLVSSK